MNVYEAMSSIRPMLEKLQKSGVDLSNINNIDMYEEYREMSKDGEKKMYIVSFLAEKYKMSEKSVSRAIRRFSMIL